MKSKLPCLVCGADSIGINFSVRSCKPCASFYRRCIAERKNYICKNGNQCEIDQQQRQQCRACRLKKCKDVGMSNEIRDNPPICAFPPLPVTPTENLQFEQKYLILTELSEAWNTFQTSLKSLLKIVHPQASNNFAELQLITKLEYERLEVGMASLLLSMLNEKFESFQKLDEQNRNRIYKRFCVRLFYLHIIFMTSLIYPDDLDDRIVLYNVFYLSIPTFDQFFKNCDTSQVNFDEIKNVWKISYEKILKVKRHFVRLQIREIEAVFLTGVLYYDEIDDIEQMDENIEQLFKQLKREMFDNLIENYGIDDGVPRMAEIMKFVSDINLNSLRENAENAQRNAEKFQQEQNRLQNLLETLKKQFENSETEKIDIQNEIDRTQKELLKINADIKQIELENLQFQQEISRIEEEISKIKAENIKIEAEIEIFKQKVDEKLQEKQDLQKQNEICDEKISDLMAQIDELKKSENGQCKCVVM